MISIVLPTFNGKDYIRHSIESIIDQSYADWELIIVDDCSTDGTNELIDRYVERDSRIRAIHNANNMNLPNSLNIGFESARGEYLTWTSDDNIYYRNALSIMKKYLEDNPDVPMVCSNMDLIDEKGTVYGKEHGYNNDYMYYNNCVGASFLYRNTVAETIGEYDTNKFGIEDYDYWLRILDVYDRIDYIDETLYAYRTHSRSLTGTKWKTIKKRLNELRRERYKQIYSKLYLNDYYMVGLYFDMLITNSVPAEMDNMISDSFPLINEVRPEINASKKTIIYGAGEYGDKTYHLLGDKVSYYADADSKKKDTIKNGIRVLGIDEFYDKAGEYQIVLALDSLTVYRVLVEFLSTGMEDITTFQHLMKNQK